MGRPLLLVSRAPAVRAEEESAKAEAGSGGRVAEFRMDWRFLLEDAVRAARARTGVPGVAAALSIGGEASSAADGVLLVGGSEHVTVETPFRVASVSKPFTATLAARTVALDDELRSLL